MGNLEPHYLIIAFSLIVILSYFFNAYSKRSGIPSVLMLLALGVVINGGLRVFGTKPPSLDLSLEIFGQVGLTLIVLEAALDLKLLKEKITIIIRSLCVSFFGLAGTSCIAAICFSSFVEGLLFKEALLFTIPLSILSSAIILPSIESLDQEKKEFMVYESTFSDIFGIISFYAVKDMVQSNSLGGVFPETLINLIILIFVSIVISYALIYIFQNLKGHAKLFLLISVLLLLYSVGHSLHVGGELIIIFAFGIVLNNHKLFIQGYVKEFFLTEKLDEILDDFKLITAESAFIVRTFFFIMFGITISLASILNFKVLLLGGLLIFIIYFVRSLCLFIFSWTVSIPKISPELFLAPRGLITILLFFDVRESLSSSLNFEGILLFVIISSCLIMTWSLVREKKRLLYLKEEEFETIDEGDVFEIDKNVSED